MSFGDVEDKSNNGDVPCKARPQMCLLAMFLKGSLKVVIVVWVLGNDTTQALDLTNP